MVGLDLTWSLTSPLSARRAGAVDSPHIDRHQYAIAERHLPEHVRRRASGSYGTAVAGVPTTSPSGLPSRACTTSAGRSRPTWRWPGGRTSRSLSCSPSRSSPTWPPSTCWSAGATGERRALRVTPVTPVTLDQARAWIRGTKPLPGTDRRVFLTEVPDRELPRSMPAVIGGAEVADSLG